MQAASRQRSLGRGKRSMGADGQSTHPTLLPPLHGNHAEVPQTCTWALLDLYAYIAERENATTAHGKMSDGELIRVTFCAAPPPLVSYLCVWCPDLAPTELNMRPTILAAESDLLLFCVRRTGRGHADVFVYKAAGGGQHADSSLTLLPDPTSHLTHRYNITLLTRNDVFGRHRLGRHGEGAHFYMALLKSSFDGGDGHYDLCVFDSKNETWTTRDVAIDSPYCHITTKVVLLGEGGLLAFVDLWRGIIVCDVLGSKPPRFVPLPPELFRPDTFGDPFRSRDIAYIGGCLTIVELRHISDPGSSTSLSWEVSAWTRTVTDLWEVDWQHQHTIRSGSIAVDGNTENVGLLPKLRDSEGTLRPALGSLYTDHPTLSLTDSHVVYIMAKVGLRDKKALILSVDMSTRRVRGLAVFDAERMLGYTYTQSRIPQYFSMAPGARKTPKRPVQFHMQYPCKLQNRVTTVEYEDRYDVMDVD